MIGSTNTAGGIGYAFSVTGFRAVAAVARVQLTWTDPDDGDWLGTRIVRKVGGYPVSVADGKLVVDSRARNAFAATPFEDLDVVGDTTYYYQAFPYAYWGNNTSDRNRAMVTSSPYDFLWSFSGAHTVRRITSAEGDECTLITMTGSGTLHIDGIRDADVWLCGGGAKGGDGYAGSGGMGGAGAYVASAPGYRLTSGPVLVGSGNGGTTTYNGVSAAGATTYGSGGTGGGAANSNNGGRGDGVPKTPFGIGELLAHCPGGGGGASYDESGNNRRSGGQGGTNGGNGGQAWPSDGQTRPGGAGGVFGGGKGGDAISGPSVTAASPGTFYGAGGGGGAGSANGGGSGADGYQGVFYILFHEILPGVA